MKNFCTNLILLSFSGIFIKLFLPKGERSPLYAPLKFILSLGIILCVFSPVFSLFQSDFSLPDLTLSETDLPKGEELVLQKMEERMIESVKKAYPKEDFTLTILADENFIPERIRLLCNNESSAREIKDFIKLKYKLETEIITR